MPSRHDRRNVSVEDPLVRGFRDLFWFDFRDAEVRDAYLADTVHQAVGARLVAELDGGPDGVFVCDFDVSPGPGGGTGRKNTGFGSHKTDKNADDAAMTGTQR